MVSLKTGPPIFNHDWSKTPFERVNNVTKILMNDHNGFESSLLKSTTLFSANGTTGLTTWSFTVPPNALNKGGTLHGGAAATLMDTLTSMSVTAVAKEGYLDCGHVSRTLTVSYLRPLRQGERCIVETEMISASGRTVHVRGIIKGEDGQAAVSAVHDKVLVRQKSQKSKL